MRSISIKQYIRMMHFCFKHLALGLWCGRGRHRVTEKQSERRGGEWLNKKGGWRPSEQQRKRREKEREESMAECLIDAVYGVIIGHCVSLAWDSRKCDR